MSACNELLHLKDVSRIYQINDRKVYALHKFSFSFPQKGLFAVIGKSGSGKSTLLNLMALLDKPSEGEIYYQNENIAKWKDKRKRKFRTDDIGMIFQHYNLIENETSLYNIMLPSFIKGEKYSKTESRAKELLTSISFKEELYNQKVYNLSGGEKQRIAILRALMNNPRIIFADEPTGALDSRNSLLIMQTLKKISEEKLVIVVSHNLSLVEEFADKVITLRDGKYYEK